MLSSHTRSKPAVVRWRGGPQAQEVTDLPPNDGVDPLRRGDEAIVWPELCSQEGRGLAPGVIAWDRRENQRMREELERRQRGD